VEDWANFCGLLRKAEHYVKDAIKIEKKMDSEKNMYWVTDKHLSKLPYIVC
jgi:hypothetical protein